MNRKGTFIILFLCSIIVSFIIVNIDFNADEELDMAYSNQEYYNDEVDLYYESSEVVYDELVAIDVLNETNKYRKDLNIHPLVLDSKLSKIATIRAMEISQSKNLSHIRLNGTYYSELFEKYSIKSNFSGENIAKGYINAKEVCEGWKNSKGHYENMIKTKYNKIGIGYYTYNGITYWVQIFSD